MEHLTTKDAGVRRLMPKMCGRVEGTAPKHPNVFSDGSLKSTRGFFWMVRGARVWWPARDLSTITKEENEFVEFCEHEVAVDLFATGPRMERKGIMLWCPFNSRLNSSTRCELGVAILTLLSPYSINNGIDDATVVKEGNEIIQHLRRQEKEEMYDAEGRRKLGGSMSVLHRAAPFKQRWAPMRDGDLWVMFVVLVKQRGPHSVCIPKVKGHSSKEMLEEGLVVEEDKEGNVGVDAAAELGATKSQARVRRFGEMYCKRHKLYRTLMCRILRFVGVLKREERRLKVEEIMKKDPFDRQEENKVVIPKHLKHTLV